jgi:large subunit ribosomal protein L9
MPQLQKVLLEADVEGLGKMGQIVEVKVAYATNVIVAKGLGSVASKEMVAQIAKSEAEAVIASAEEKKKATATKATLQQRYAKAGIVFEVQVAKDGSIATVGSEEVAAEISRSGTPVLAVNVEMDVITELGDSVIATVVLHKEVDMQVKVEVIKSKITFG